MTSISHPCQHVTLAAVLFVPCVALAQVSTGKPRTESLQTSVMFGYESVRLPQGERMGLVGGSVLFDIGRDWYAGPAVYGAARGERGGLFVGGVELQRRWSLAPGWSVGTGLYAGGGGGADAPVGGGLMLRPAVTLLKDLGPMQWGLSLSSVRFPTGQITSNQVGLVVAWRDRFVHLTEADRGPATSLDSSTGLGFDRMAMTGTSYRFTDGSGRHIGLAGARAEHRSEGNRFSWGVETAGAAKGDAAGYMEILATGAISTAVLPSLRVGARVGAGLAGGGAVPTAGGAIGKLTGTMEWSLAPGWTLGGDYGWVRSASGAFQAQQAQVWLGIDLEPRLHGQRVPAGSVVRTEWVGVLQHYVRAERRDGTSQSLDTIGLKLNRYLSDRVYLSGQAHSAYAGGAGAYSVGLVGAGLVTSAKAPLRAGVEVLVGAAGGGGVRTSGGAIAQGLLWAGWQQSPQSEWRAGIGTVRGLQGGLNSPLIELSWSRAFGMAGQ